MADCDRDDQLWMFVVGFSFDIPEVLDDLACGAVVGVKCDEEYAYATVIEKKGTP